MTVIEDIEEAYRTDLKKALGDPVLTSEILTARSKFRIDQLMDCTCKICEDDYCSKDLKRSLGDVDWLLDYCSAFCYTKAINGG